MHSAALLIFALQLAFGGEYEFSIEYMNDHERWDYYCGDAIADDFPDLPCETRKI